ncbi:MAG: SUMF1/EgtB/PvdO family nonheme iron enzyme [Flavobacteriales bacterium]
MALAVGMLLLAQSAHANNIQVSNITLQNNTGSSVMLHFDVTWENSWRGGPVANWDAAWLFAKVRLSSGEWQHIKLANSGHETPAGTQIELGLVLPASAYNSSSNPVVGAFLHRNTNGYGNLDATGVQLLWNYQDQGIAVPAQVAEVRVHAIEMVYVNEGAFMAGGGGLGGVYTYPTTSTPYAVTSEAAISVGTVAGQLYYAEGTGQSGDRGGPIPANYPKGFNAFYAMKYEVSQQGYVDFLNTLTYAQQVTRTATAPNSAAGTGALSSTNADRNGIDISTPGVDPGTAAVYACNLNGNGIYGEADDGTDIACNHLSISDLWAYLDWSGLRPMSELEFEKACRGPLPPVAGEYPWGAGVALFGYTLSDAGTAHEGISTEYSSTNGNAVWQNTSVNFDGPVRVGAFAANAGNTGRVTSGASYYGIMELGGNVAERAVTLGHPGGRGYNGGSHGNGELATNGTADPNTWSSATTATGFRGGDWTINAAGRLQAADRGLVNWARTGRYAESGGRGVRTAP